MFMTEHGLEITRGAEADSKTVDLSNWVNVDAIHWDGEDGRGAGLGTIRTHLILRRHEHLIGDVR